MVAVATTTRVRRICNKEEVLTYISHRALPLSLRWIVGFPEEQAKARCFGARRKISTFLQPMGNGETASQTMLLTR